MEEEPTVYCTEKEEEVLQRIVEENAWKSYIKS